MNEHASQTKAPKLFVVGAGPGDPDLITVKGRTIIEQARVILYDNLANEKLLHFAPSDCELIYVGKKPYGAYTPQDEIHRLIREKADEKGQVVRLKGGDPFIFGRGFEEVLFARQHGIETEFIPGITSMQLSGLDDVPLTHRSLSESVWVVTGTKKDGNLSDDLKLAIKSRATVVIYMGMRKLPEISATYRDSGYGDMPGVIIQHASLPQRKTVFGNAGDLASLAETHQLSHPAIIIIGRVAGKIA